MSKVDDMTPLEEGLSGLGAELKKNEGTHAGKQNLGDLDAFMAATGCRKTAYLALITGHYEVGDGIDPTQLVFSVRSLNAMTRSGSVVLYGEHSEMLYNRVTENTGVFAVLERDLMNGSHYVYRDREVRDLFPGEVIFDVGLQDCKTLSREDARTICIWVDRVLVFKQMGATSTGVNAFAIPDWVL